MITSIGSSYVAGQRYDERKAKEAELANTQVPEPTFEELKAELERKAEMERKELEIAKQRIAIEKGRSTSIRKVWTFEVTDISLVPKEFVTVDKNKVDNLIHTGTREIPGLRIFQREDLNLR